MSRLKSLSMLAVAALAFPCWAADAGPGVPGVPEVAASSKERAFQLTAKFDWPLLFGGGGAGSLGVGFDHFELGAMGVVTPLSPYFRDTFLTGAEGTDVKLNWGAELYLQWFPRADRRWFFVGAILSFDGFHLVDQQTGERGAVYGFYLAPRAGLRIPLYFDWLTFEPSVGAALRLWDNGPVSVGGARVDVQPVAPLTFLSLGVAL